MICLVSFFFGYSSFLCEALSSDSSWDCVIFFVIRPLWDIVDRKEIGLGFSFESEVLLCLGCDCLHGGFSISTRCFELPRDFPDLLCGIVGVKIRFSEREPRHC